MQDLTLFYLKNCPYCISAMRILDELIAEEPYRGISVHRIEESEQPDLADQFDYYYVPTFFFNQQKLFEGAMERKDVLHVLNQVVDHESL